MTRDMVIGRPETEPNGFGDVRFDSASTPRTELALRRLRLLTLGRCRSQRIYKKPLVGISTRRQRRPSAERGLTRRDCIFPSLQPSALQAKKAQAVKGAHRPFQSISVTEPVAEQQVLTPLSDLFVL